MCGHVIVSYVKFLAMTDQTDAVTAHAIEFDVYSFAIILFWIQDDGLNGNCEEKVDYFKGSVKYIT